MKRARISRRAFLRGAGGTVLTLPYLDYFAGKARAQTATAMPKRLVIFQHPQGMVMDRWTPSGTGTGYTLSEILEPLSAHRENILVLSGIDNLVRMQMQRGNAHNPAARSLLTCWPYAGSMNADGTVKAAGEQVENGPSFGPSIEHVIASRMETRTRYDRLDYKVNGMGVGENQIFWAEDQIPIEAESDPVQAFNALMSQIGPVDEMTQPSYADRLRMHRGSVLDSVLESFDRLSSRLGAEDRARLDAHATMIRRLEQNLDTPISASCTPHTQSMPAGYDFNNRDFDNASAPALIDNMVLALSCDLTRVATLQFADGHAPTFSWLDANVPGGWENWHDMVHSGQSDEPSRASMVQCMRWYTEQFAYLLDRMSTIEEADGSTLLDNSLVLWISEFGNGGAHNTRTLPVVIGGNLGGTIATGRHLSMTGRTTGDLFSTILNLFGHGDEEFGLNDSLTGATLNNGPFEIG